MKYFDPYEARSPHVGFYHDHMRRWRAPSPWLVLARRFLVPSKVGAKLYWPRLSLRKSGSLWRDGYRFGFSLKEEKIRHPYLHGKPLTSISLSTSLKLRPGRPATFGRLIALKSGTISGYLGACLMRLATQLFG